MKGIKKGLLIFISIISLFIFTNKLDASSGSISVSSSRSSMIVGNTFYVDVTISSSSPLGSVEYTISYDSSKVRLESGDSTVKWYTPNSSTYSQTFSYTFKAISSGTSYITVKSYGGYSYDENRMELSAGSAKVSAITQAELEASYSKNNNLSAITVDKGVLSPAFSPDITEYTVSVGSNVEKIFIDAFREDRYSTLTGYGEYDVTEGDNKFEIKCVAENGTPKIYTVTVKVEDVNPIVVKVGNKEYTIVKRASTIKVPETYTLSTTTIEGNEVPAAISDVTNMILVGLKDSEGVTSLYVYDKENNTYSLYSELKTNSLKLFITDSDKMPKGYNLTTLEIGDFNVPAYKSSVSKNYLINALNIETNEETIYEYDKENNSLVKYDDNKDKEIESLNETLTNYKYIIIGLGVETILVTIVMIIVLIKKAKLKKKVLNIENTIRIKTEEKEKKKATK